MLLKIFSLFLIGMAVLAVFGRLRFPGGGRKSLGAAKCPKCGRPKIGKGPCDCGKGSKV
jgi:hypothetical protein